MLSFLLGLIGAIIALLGWFAWKSPLLLLVGTALYIVETIMEWENLNFNAKKLDLAIFAIGSIAAIAFTSSPWYIGGMVAIAIYNLLTCILGVISMIFFLFK